VLAAVVRDAFLASFRGGIILCAALVFIRAALAAATLAPVAPAAAVFEVAPLTCEHVATIAAPKPLTRGCEECVRTGDT